jgi:uncharacterized SAM-binding protein YcdF (DUF218 family)
VEFVLAKIAGPLLRPSTLTLILLALGLVLLAFGRRRWGWRAIGAVVAIMAAAALLPVAKWTLAPLENRFPSPVLPAEVEGIVVLGGAIDPGLSADRDTPAINGNVERLTEFAALARNYPGAKLVFTGGSGRIGEPEAREADWMRRLAPRLGLDPARMVFERESRNTAENARLARAAAKPGTGIWLLVTSARHMPRAMGAFRAAGWRVVAIPVDYRTRQAGDPPALHPLAGLAVLDAAAQEWLGLVWYRINGHTDRLFPGPE